MYESEIVIDFLKRKKLKTVSTNAVRFINEDEEEFSLLDLLTEYGIDRITETMVNLHSSYIKSSDKPLLRPISDMTREINHLGEKFIPIVKILRSLGVMADCRLIHDNDEPGCEWGDTHIISYKRYNLIYDAINKVFTGRKGISASMIEYDMLREWGFDVDLKIPKGKAYNINKIQ